MPDEKEKLNTPIPVVPLRDFYFTYPSYGLTPEKLGRIFREADDGDISRQSELFIEMEEKDPHIFSQFQIRKLAVQGLPWHIIPADDSKPSADISEEVTKMMTRLLNYDNILDMLDAVPKGFSAMQIVWDISELQWDINYLKHIDPRLIIFDNENYEPRILTVDSMVEGVPFPKHKIFYNRYKARSGYDTRAGILRVCAWMYLFKNYGVKDWVAFAEVFGMPLRLGKYDTNAGQESKDALIAAVRSLGSDAAGVISKDTEIEFVNSAGKGDSVGVFKELVSFCDAQCSKAIRGQVHTAYSESSGIGTYGMGKADEGIAYELMEADCVSLSAKIQYQLINPYVRFNHGENVVPPKFAFAYKKYENLAELVPVYEMLKNIGFPMSQEHISERFGVPIMNEKETPLQDVSVSPQISMKGYALKSRFSDIDDDSVLDDANRRIEKLTKRAVSIVSKAKNFEDAGKLLNSAYPDLNDNELEKILGRSIFGSVLSGYEMAVKDTK